MLRVISNHGAFNVYTADKNRLIAFWVISIHGAYNVNIVHGSRFAFEVINGSVERSHFIVVDLPSGLLVTK